MVIHVRFVVIRRVRSKIALGKETGKKGKPLPKAYGMNKLVTKTRKNINLLDGTLFIEEST